MPKMLTIEPNPDWKPAASLTAARKKVVEAEYADIGTKGAIAVSYVTAMENIRQSGGMYRVKPAAAPASASPVLDLEAMPIDQLKLMLVTLGIKTEKKMLKADIIRLIRSKLDEIEVEEAE